MTRASPLYARILVPVSTHEGTSTTVSDGPVTTVKAGTSFQINVEDVYYLSAPILLAAATETIVSSFDNTMVTYAVTGAVATPITTVEPGKLFTVGSGKKAVAISVPEGVSFVDRYYSTTAIGTAKGAQSTAFVYEVLKGAVPSWAIETVTPGQVVTLSDAYGGYVLYTPTSAQPPEGIITHVAEVSDGGTTVPFTYAISAAPPPPAPAVTTTVEVNADFNWITDSKTIDILAPATPTTWTITTAPGGDSTDSYSFVLVATPRLVPVLTTTVTVPSASEIDWVVTSGETVIITDVAAVTTPTTRTILTAPTDATSDPYSLIIVVETAQVTSTTTPPSGTQNPSLIPYTGVVTYPSTQSIITVTGTITYTM